MSQEPQINEQLLSNATQSDPSIFTFIEQLKETVRKEAFLRMRDLVNTVNRVLIPIYMLFILVILNNTSGSAGKSSLIMTESALPLIAAKCPGCIHIAYYPTAAVDGTAQGNMDSIISKAVQILSVGESTSLNSRFFASEDALVQYRQSATVDNQIFSAVAFSPSLTTSIVTGNPPLSYSIRVPAEKIYGSQASGGSQPLFDTGVVSIQSAMDQAINAIRRQQLGLTANSGPTWTIQMSSFVSRSGNNISFLSPYYFVFMCTPVLQIIIQRVSQDRISRIRSTLQMMGLPSTVYFVGYLIVDGILGALTVLLVMGISFGFGLFKLSDFGLLWLSMSLYLWNLLPFGVMLSLPLKESSASQSIANNSLVLQLVAFGLSQLFIFNSDTVPSGQYGVYLIPAVCFGRIIDVATTQEFRHIGATRSNWSDVGLSAPLGYLFLDFVLYAIIASYLDYHYGGDERRMTKTSSIFAQVTKNAVIDPNLPDGDGAIQVKQLSKVFQVPNDNGKGFKDHVAVAGLDLTLHSGEIFALLGHNGSGKTTTISCLTGLLTPTSGDATIFGKSVCREIFQVRQSLGICQQFDVLYDDMTALEHLRLYSAVKRAKCNNADQVTYFMALLDCVSLKENAYERVAKFSGGMKRKLSIAIALLGNPKFILLDEPTQAIDVYTRQSIWRLLQNLKRDRVILLTTHSMEEADVLGDRIAIVSKGSLQTLGTSIFLKNHFGEGYKLRLVKELSSGQIDTDGLLQFVREFVPSARLEQLADDGSDIMIALPRETFDETVYAQLVDALPQAKKQFQLFITSIAASTLEAVFMELGKDDLEQL